MALVFPFHQKLSPLEENVLVRRFIFNQIENRVQLHMDNRKWKKANKFRIEINDLSKWDYGAIYIPHMWKANDFVVAWK